MARALIVLTVSGLGVAAGVLSLHVARHDPGFWFAGASAGAGAVLLAAGWALIGCGLASWLRRPGGRGWPLLVAAGFGWFLLEWNNPGVGSALVFTIGLVLYASGPPLAAHAVLAYPGGRLRSWPERGVLSVAYAGALLLLGLLPAVFFDPQAEGCSSCPPNLVLVTADAELNADLNRAGVYVGLAWALALAVLALVRIGRGPAAARPLLAAGTVYLGLVAGWFVLSLDRGFLASGGGARSLWLAQAGALMGVALGVAWGWVRARRARSSVARLVVDLARTPPPGGLRDVLSAIVGDPELVVAYPLESGRLVDAQGRPVDLTMRLEQTSLVRDGRPVAVLAHAPGLLGDAELVDQVTAAARLALENERLQAEVRARLKELRASRTRIVEAGDAERRRLERDLHDGAQQRLVGLLLSLRLLRMRLPLTPQLEQADAELRGAIAELREVAHGIFPAVLADEGLAAAIGALAEEGHVPIRVGSIPDERFSSAVETAAYTLVAEAARTAGGALAVWAWHRDRMLAIEVETPSLDGLDLAALEDRVGALDGQMSTAASDWGVTIRAELPCGS